MNVLQIVDLTRGKQDKIQEGENIILFNLPAYYVNDLMAIGFGKILQNIDEDADVQMYSTDQTVTLQVELSRDITIDEIIAEVQKYFNQPFIKTLRELADVGKEWASAKKNKKYDLLLQIYDKYVQKFAEFENVYNKYHDEIDIIMSVLSGNSIDRYYNSKKKYLDEKMRNIVATDRENAVKKVKISTGSGDFDDVFNSKSGYVTTLLKVIKDKKPKYKIPTSFDLGTQFVKTTEYSVSKDHDKIRMLTPLEYGLFIIGAIESRTKVHSIKNTSVYFILKPTVFTPIEDVIKFYNLINEKPVTEYDYVKIDEEGQTLSETRKIYSNKLTEEEMLEKMFINILLRLGYHVSVYQKQADMIRKVEVASVDKNLSTISDMYIDAVMLAGNTKKVIRFVPRDFLDTLEFIGISFTGHVPRQGEHTQIITAIHRYFNVPPDKNDLIGKFIKNEKNIVIEIADKKYLVDQKILDALVTMNRRSAIR